jgi:ABC-type phosphate transport system substrate-binding protein
MMKNGPCVKFAYKVMVWAVLSVAPALPANAQISVIVARTAAIKANADARRDSVKMTKSEVKEIFTGTRLKWTNGNKIQVVDQPETRVGKKFYETVVGKTVNQNRQQWTKLLLSGQASPPIRLASDKAVKKTVAGNPQAIGYIATDTLDDSVQEILRIE